MIALGGARALGKGRAMVSGQPTGVAHGAEWSFAALMPRREFVRAVGRFDGDATAMLRQSVQAAGRAFDELGVCDEVLDRAATEGMAVTEELGRCLVAENEHEVPRLIDRLQELADRVRRSEGTRAVVSRILGQAEQPEPSVRAVPHLAEEQLPRVPTLYDEEDGEHYGDLERMLKVRAERLPERAHAERVEQVARHLTAVAAQMAEQGFVDRAFTAAALKEARSACDLWSRCLAERRRDLQ
ncbi:hypothetical protein ACFWIQ_10375 [Kitasatospora sp. NPDC127059]|uniref:hypothetical protein n=1 Tax=unclassified Kitasatospora TaxID=2633591 RepID=UPI003665DD96